MEPLPYIGDKYGVLVVLSTLRCGLMHTGFLASVLLKRQQVTDLSVITTPGFLLPEALHTVESSRYQSTGSDFPVSSASDTTLVWNSG